MMKGRRILAVVLALVMTVSLGLVSTVYAASPLAFDGAETVLFNQSFAGLKSAADAPDFTFTKGKGTGWEFYDFFTMSAGSNNTASVATKNSYNLTGAAGFELVVNMESTSNKAYINMPGGYQLSYSNSKTGWAAAIGKTNYIALLKDGAILTADEDGNTGYKYCYSYDADITYTIRYVNGVWTVNAKTKTNENTGSEGVTFTYKDSSDVMSSFNGKFGVAGDYTTKITLYSMKLTQIGETATVNKWKYDTDFKTTDTRDDYIAEGLTIPAAMTIYDGYAKLTKNGNITYAYSPNSQKFSGDYSFAFDQGGANQNARKIRFNYIDANNCYELFIYHKAGAIDVSEDVIASDKYPATYGWVLRKISGGTKTTLATQDLAGTDFSGSTQRFKYNVKVKNVDAGRKIDVTVSLPDSPATTPLTMTATDVLPFEQNGTINMYQAYPGTDTKLYGFNAYSILEATAGTPVTVSETVIDKTFSSADSTTSIVDEGFTTSLASSVTVSITDADGLTFSGKSNTLIYTNSNAINGTYSLSTSFKHGNNYASVYFNRKDSTNYYVLESNYYTTPKTLSLKKVCNGTTYVLDSVTLGSTGAAGRNVVTTVDVNVTENSDGSLTINTKWSNSKLTKEYTYTDSATDMIDADGDGTKETDTGAPITSGDARVYVGYSKSYVYTFKLVKYTTEMQGGTSEVPEYSAVFYGDSGVIKEVASGNIYFEYPVARLGTYTAVATLHEGNEMTGLKVLSPLELYSGKIWLFNVADASDAKVRIYFFDAEDTLNRLTEVYELN